MTGMHFSLTHQTFLQRFSKFPALYGNRKFIIVFRAVTPFLILLWQFLWGCLIRFRCISHPFYACYMPSHLQYRGFPRFLYSNSAAFRMSHKSPVTVRRSTA